MATAQADAAEHADHGGSKLLAERQIETSTRSPYTLSGGLLLQLNLARLYLFRLRQNYFEHAILHLGTDFARVKIVRR